MRNALTKTKYMGYMLMNNTNQRRAVFELGLCKEDGKAQVRQKLASSMPVAGCVDGR